MQSEVRMNKKSDALIILLALASIFIISGCQTQKQPVPVVIKEQRVFWGNKDEIKIFLDSPKAQSERWFVQALGD